MKPSTLAKSDTRPAAIDWPFAACWFSHSLRALARDKVCQDRPPCC
ncbi:Uncharacterised protein [Vibrio cholerae]|nr:Uncharacterised protein [Vibrio cholerae]CSI58444.1 Uncharacterised protein [Vibrio cholerae]